MSERSPVTPPESRRPSIRLTFISRAISLELAQGNAHLSAGRPVTALNIYTHILTETSPGHPCAFLNRSLCYLVLDYPSLAAVDAYRALLAASWAKPSEPGDQPMKQLYGCSQITEEAQAKGEPWATPPTCFVGGGVYKWLAVNLASLVVEKRIRERIVKAAPESGSEAKPTVKITRPLVTLLAGVQMKARYRLALALWKCGGGALRSAFDVLCDAREMTCCEDEDKKQFDDLDDRILKYIEKHVEEEKDMKKHVLARGQLSSDDPESHRSFELSGIKGLLPTRYTKIKRELYPWDNYSLTVESLSQQIGSLRKIVARYAAGCQVRALIDATPKLVPYATLDINAQDEVFSENSPFCVTSSIQRDDELFCDTCGAALRVTPELLYHATDAVQEVGQVMKNFLDDTGDPQLRRPTPSDREGDIEEKLKDLAARAYNVARSSVEAHSPLIKPVTPPDHGDRQPKEITQSDPKGFQVCPDCREVVFCSLKCRSSALNAFHAASCDRDIEILLRDLVLDQRFRDLPEPNRQRLQSLMLLRILAHGMQRGYHPLEIDRVRLMSGNQDKARLLSEEVDGRSMSVMFDDNETTDVDTLFPDDEFCGKIDGNNNNDTITDENTLELSPKAKAKGGPRRGNAVDTPTRKGTFTPALIPWSFDANVVQPIRCLVMMGGSKAALDIKKYDGWILQTLIARIDATMRVTTHPRVWKTFDRWDNVCSEESIIQDTESSERPKNKTEENDEEDQVWVGSLHPLASLIPIAALGEYPNVNMFEDNGLIVCKASAVRTDSSGVLQVAQLDIDSQKANSQPRIRTGEILLRTAEICSRPGVHRSSDDSKPLDADRSSSCGDTTMDTADTMLEAAETDYDLEDVDLDDLTATEGDAEMDG